MKFYRTSTVLSLSFWPEKKKVFVELTPAIPGKKGQPQSGENRYDYTKTIRISFQLPDILSAAYHFIGLSHGQDVPFEKFADMSKSPHTESNDKKSLKVFLGERGGVFVGLTQGDQKLNFTLSNPEANAVGKWFEIMGTRYINDEVTESINNPPRKSE